MKVVICGAGMAGLALARHLDVLGWEVVVLEKFPGLRRQGYMVDFLGPGYDAAEAMGVLPRLRELSYDMDEATYVDGAGRRRASMDYAQLARLADGRLLNLMRPDLEAALHESLGPGVEMRFGTSITHVADQTDGVRVELTDGTTLDADLLVGADGIHSVVRRLAFGADEPRQRYLGFHTSAFFFDDPRIHAQLRDRYYLTDTIDRMVGMYGLRDGRVAAFTVHRADDPSHPRDAQAAIRAEYGSLGWIVPEALAQCPPGDDIYYDPVVQIELPRWSRGRVTLVGDACQAVSLLAGQGASLAVAGAYLLAEHLTRGDSIEAGLRQYEQQWRPVIEHRQRVARRFARWFVPPSRLIRRVRRTGLQLARLPGSDRYMTAALFGEAPAPLPPPSRSGAQH